MFIALASTERLFFIAFAHVHSLLWQLKVSIDLYWGKWKLAFVAMTLQIFWQTFYKNVPGVVLYQTYHFCPNLWIWLVAMATKRINLREKKKIISIKLKLCRNVHNISLYKNNDFIAVAHVLPLLWQLSCKFPLTYNGKSENWHLLISHCRYFDKSFSEIFVEWSSAKPLNLIGCHGNQKVNFWKNIKKSTPQKLYGDQAETLQKCS